MKTRVTDLLYFGDGTSCAQAQAQGFAVVHACKDPCHRHALGYSQKSLDAAHPHYLAYEKDDQLFLNMIDPPIPLFKLESFQFFLDFADRMAAGNKPLLIHCNQGMSRAPSLTLVYMAKRLNLLPNESYALARTAFADQFSYAPGTGISRFLTEHWAQLD